MGKLFAHTIHQMYFRTHSKLAALGRRGNHLDQAFGGADAISLLADLPAAFGMNNDLDPRMQRAKPVHMFRQKALMHRAMALPQNHFRLAQPRRIYSAATHEWVH